MWVVNWNVEWATPNSRRGKILLSRIFELDPEIVCLTEGYIDFLPQDGFTIASEPNYGYANPDGKRRKVLLWSKRPWQAVDSIGHAALPNGRFVRGTTETSIGVLNVVGVCVPWRMAHVTSGRRDRQVWEDHLAYLTALEPLLASETAPLILLGDFNQRIPRRYTPLNIFEKLDEVILQKMRSLSSGTIPDVEKQTVDHIFCSYDLHSTKLNGWSNRSETVKKLSDHFGIALTLQKT